MTTEPQTPMEYRVRFAPSPTGPLHIGGLRTAVFNWLLARHHQGVFLVRIEDTDRKRSESQYTDSILQALEWLGMDIDEAPVHQSAHLRSHQAAVTALLHSGAAYPCFCTQERLQAARAGSYKYDRTCAAIGEKERESRIAAGEPYVVRFLAPEGETSWTDLVHGTIQVQHRELEDFVLQRRDGTPTYQVAVVSDDHTMNVTHVIRGDDHLSNTPKQILLYKALGYAVPKFGHIPLIFGPNRKKLSKRHGPVAWEMYREKGYLPEALLNYLSFLGWATGDETEIMDRDTLIRRFSMRGISASNAVFDEQKLQWMNGQYLNRLTVDQLRPLVLPRFERYGWDVSDVAYVERVITLLQTRTRTLEDFPVYAACFFADPTDYEEKARKKHWTGDVKERLVAVRKSLMNLDDFSQDAVETAVRGLAEAHGHKAALYIHPIRLAVTGMSVSPDLFAVLDLLGSRRVLHRLQEAIQYLAKYPTA